MSTESKGGEPGACKSCTETTKHHMQHPYGQLACLLFITLPMAIPALTIAISSFNTIETAVGHFEKILSNWQQPTMTDIKVLSRDATCPAGYSLLNKRTWPGSNSGPCACPATTYQPWNTASSSEVTSGLRSVYGREATERIGAWGTTICYTDVTTRSSDYPFHSSYPSCYYSSGGSCIVNGQGIQCSGNTRCVRETSTSTRNYRRRRRTESSTRRIGSRRNNAKNKQEEARRKKEEEKAKPAEAATDPSQRRECRTTGVDEETCTTYYQSTYDSSCYPISYQDSGSSTCGSSQKAMLCVTDPAIGEVDLTKWRNSTICAKRNGTPVISTAGNARPEPPCPSGYDQCGTGDYNSARSTCTPTGTPCPITNMKVFSSTSDASYVANDWSSHETFAGGQILAYRTAQKASKELPVTETWQSWEQTYLSGGYSLSSGRYSGTSLANPAWSQPFGGGPGTVDPRFSTADSLTANTYLQDQFNTWCGHTAVAVPVAPIDNANSTGNTTRRGQNIAPSSLLVQRRSANSGRRRGVVQTGLDPHLEWPDNAAPQSTGEWLYNVNYASYNSDASTYCTTNDKLCSKVMTRSLCDKFSAYATAAGTSKSVLQSVRNELFYKIDKACATKQDLYDSGAVITSLRDVLHTQLIFHWLDITAGTFFTLLKIYRDYIGMHDNSKSDDDAQIFYSRINYAFDVFCKIATIVTIILSFQAAGEAGDAFENAAACTDATTASQGFKTLDETIKEIKANTVTNLILEVLMSLFLLFTIYTAKAFNDYDPNMLLAEQATQRREEEAAERAAGIELGPPPEWSNQA